jgi:uncharacterized lipoprotein YajG
MSSARFLVAVLVALSTLAAVAGCARSALDVRYAEAGANRAMLASVPPRRVAIPPMTDRRMDTTRIGRQPKSAKDIVTRRPVVDIVREALAIEVSKNGHSVVSDGKDVVLAAEVEEFWLDVIAGSPKSQYVGKVAIAVLVADGRSGDTLLTRRYVGIKRLQADTDSKTAGRDVMDAALARTIHDFATDPQLIMALARVETAERPR